MTQLQFRMAALSGLAGLALLAGAARADDGHGKHGHDFPKDVDALHAVIAPLWHSPSGADRSRQTCRQVATMERLANEVRSADARPIGKAIAELKARCKTSPRDIDAEFVKVHDAFHDLAGH